MATYNLPCPHCGSSNAVTDYGPNKGAYCHKCKTVVNKITEVAAKTDYHGLTMDIIESSPIANLAHRAIADHFAAEYKVKAIFNQITGRLEYAAYPYTDFNGKVTGYKVKHVLDKSKTFIVGKLTCGFGLANIRDGRFIILVEGEEDCIAARQLLAMVGKDYNVVSISDGASEGDISKNTAALMHELSKRYEAVCICFDQDTVGQSYALTLAKKYIAIIKISLATWPNPNGEFKDANDLLQRGYAVQFLDAINKAKKYKSDLILHTKDITGAYEPLNSNLQFSWLPALNSMTRGCRGGEIFLITGMPGCGKSTVLRTMALDFIKQNKKVAMLSLEDGERLTKQGLLALHCKIPLIRWRENPPPEGSNPLANEMEEMLSKTQTIFTKEDEQYTLDSLMSFFRELIDVEKCDVIILDPITYLVTDNGGENERMFIDKFMLALRQFKSTQCTIFICVHMKKTNAGHVRAIRKNKEDDIPLPYFETIGMDDLRGSAAYGIASNVILGLSPLITPGGARGNSTVVRVSVIKNRPTGLVGVADHYFKCPNTDVLLLTTDPTE